MPTGMRDPTCEAEYGGGLVRGHDLAGPGRVGRPPLEDPQPVLVGEQAVRAGNQLDLSLQDGLDPAGLRQCRSGDLLALLGAAHVRQPGELAHQACLRAAGLRQHQQVGRVRAGQELGIGRICAPRSGQRAQGDAADQADEQGQGEVAAPAAAERGAEAVASRPQQRFAHDGRS